MDKIPFETIIRTTLTFGLGGLGMTLLIVSLVLYARVGRR